MSSGDLDSFPRHVPTRAACPTNQEVGLPVGTLTIKALLAIPLTAVSPVETYRFCPAPDCPTVYYREDGQQVFSEVDLREHVYQKHAVERDAVVCYCFGYTRADVRAGLNEFGNSSVIGRIRTGIAAGQCACDIRNPQGECCLGNIYRLVHSWTDSTSAEGQDV